MSEYRVEGVVGPDNVPVMTDWLDQPIGEVEGIAVGMQLRGWENVEVVSQVEA